jgi:hypothetical protein
MKRLLITLALTCVLSVSAMAGTIPTMGAAPGDVPSTDCTAPGDIHTVDAPCQIPTAPGEMPTGGLSIVLAILDLVF